MSFMLPKVDARPLPLEAAPDPPRSPGPSGTTPDQENCPLPVSGAAVGCSDDCLCVPPSGRPGNVALRPGNPAFLGEYTIGALRSVKGQEFLAPRLGQVEVRYGWQLAAMPSSCVGGASL